MKKLRKDRIIFVCLCLFIILFIFIYLFSNMGKERQYHGDIETYACTYQQDDKIYAFDLKGFVYKEKQYVSLNDIYNVMEIIDKNTKVYLDQNRYRMVYKLSDKTYFFHYRKDLITCNNTSIDVKNYDSHIYISHKNVYINIFFVEKLLLNNEKSIKFKNKNAIILKNR